MTIVFFLIFHTTDRKAAALVEVAPVHVGVVVVQYAAVGVVVIVLGSTPEVGVVAETVVTAAVVARRKSRKTGYVVAALVIAHSTLIVSGYWPTMI